MTVGEAIKRILINRDAGEDLRLDLERLNAWFITTPVEQVGQEEIDEAARALFPVHSPATRGNHVYSPMRQVLRYSGNYRPIKFPKRPKPRYTVLSRETAEYLIESADDPEFQAFLVFLFFTGARLSETMTLTRDGLDLDNERVRLRLAHRQVEQWRPLHPRVCKALSVVPVRQDRLFKWKHRRRGPEKPLWRLREKTGIHFTYKTARYSFAHWLADAGANTQDVMDACGWVSVRHVMRILGGEEEIAREAIERL